MTVKSRLEEVVAKAESFHSDLVTFSNEVEDADVREMFQGMANQIERMMPKLRGRLHHIEDEEPQYH